MDSKIRSWVKSISWRLTGIILLGFISYLITKDWEKMTIITILFHSLRLILYYFHERMWEKILWGKIKHPLADLKIKKELTQEDMKIIGKKLEELGYI